jgi:hypothetical protein
MNLNKEQSAPPKKSYQTPTLRVYGDLHEITQASTNFGTHIDSRSPYTADRTH